MPKFRISVEVKAAVDYTVEVEGRSEQEAEDNATAMWKEKVPSDFNVSEGYITHWDAYKLDQLTFICERCEKEYPLLDWSKHPDAIQPWKEDQDYCAPCGVLVLEDEAAALSRKQGHA